MQRALILFAKQPAIGQSKTRLADLIGLAGAAAFADYALRDACATVRRVHDVQIIVAYAPEDAEPFFHDLLPTAHCVAQQGSDIGERMDAALNHAFADGYEKVVLIGSDVPLLSEDIIDQAFVKLSGKTEVVFGPSEDGGYYLIGLARPQPWLLRSMTYSTASVLYETLLRATSRDVRFALLPACYDIDTPHDLLRLQRDLETLPKDVAPYTRKFLEEYL